MRSTQVTSLLVLWALLALLAPSALALQDDGAAAGPNAAAQPQAGSAGQAQSQQEGQQQDGGPWRQAGAADAAAQEGAAPIAEGAKPDYIPGTMIKRTQPRIPDIRQHRIMDLPYVRTIDEVVELDLEGIDPSADPVFYIGDEPVSRAAFRRRALMYAGENEVDQHVTRLITRREIERQLAAGADESEFAVDEAAIEARLQENLDMIALRVQQQQGDPNAVPDPEEVSRQQQEWLFQIEESIGLDAYRALLRTDVQFEKVFLPWPDVSEEERAAIAKRNQERVAAGESVLDVPTEGDAPPPWLPQATWEAFMASEQGRHMLGLIVTQGASGEPMPAIFKNSIMLSLRNGLVESIGVDYFFDADMPDEVFMRIGGEDVLVDELWFMISNQLADTDVELIARELVTLRQARKALEDAGAWLSEEAWDAAWKAHNDEYKQSLLPLRSLIVFRGYSSLDRYREHYRYRISYDRWRRENLAEEDVLAHYQGGGRLFFERGNIVLAPVFKPLEAEFSEAAFEQALQEMGAFIAEHGDDWEAVQAKYPFEYKDQGPILNDQRMPARIGLSESELSILVTGYSLTDDAFYRGVEGQVIGPWAQRCRRHAWGSETNAGVWAVKVLEYTRRGSLPPFNPSDKNYDMAFDDYLTATYLDFMQDNLAAVADEVSVKPRM